MILFIKMSRILKKNKTMTFAGKLDGPGEYYANQNKSNPRKQRPNAFSDK